MVFKSSPSPVVAITASEATGRLLSVIGVLLVGALAPAINKVEWRMNALKIVR